MKTRHLALIAAALVVLAFGLMLGAPTAIGSHVPGGFWLFCGGVPLSCTEKDPPKETTTVTSTVTEPGTTTTTTTVTTTSPPPTTTTPPPTTTQPPPPDPAVPAPIAGQGYSKVFEDEFTAFVSSRWDNNIWFHGEPSGGAITVANGILTITARRSESYARREVITQPTIAFKQGYFEARMRWTKGRTAWPGFWLYSRAHSVNHGPPNGNWPNPLCPNPNCLSAELDVFEGQGHEPHVFYATLHRNSCQCYGVPNTQSSPSWFPQSGVDLTTAFHTYSALWTATEVKWFLDGRLIHTHPVYDSFNQDMRIILQMWSKAGWAPPPDASTPAELRTEVDWVRVWQK